MLITVLYNVDSTKALQSRNFVDVEKANEWITSASKSNSYFNIRLLVDYANVEHYKREFEKYQEIVLSGVTPPTNRHTPTNRQVGTIGIKEVG